MIHPKFLFEELKKNEISFYAGVPDSLLKDFCAYVTDCSESHVITANEGGAVALAAGYHLATGKVPVVYLQNSGLGNIINPVASMAHPEIYSIPMLFIIGWRGMPGEKDEPQHVKQGKVTQAQLELMDIPYSVLSDNEVSAQEEISKMLSVINSQNKPGALLIKKGTFDKYKLQKIVANNKEYLNRETAIQIVTQKIDEIENSTIISTTGMISRELFSYRNDLNQTGKDFYNVGSMGHASQIAAGISISMPHKKVFCFDGDGAALMHMGSMPIIASLNLKNYFHVVFDNEAHDSVGGQPTCTSKINLHQIAVSCGFQQSIFLKSQNDIEQFFNSGVSKMDGPIFILIKVARGNREDIMRPNLSPLENKEKYIKYLRG